LILRIDDSIPRLLPVKFVHCNLSFECGNVISFHLESMGGARNEGSSSHFRLKSRSSVYGRGKVNMSMLCRYLEFSQRTENMRGENQIISVCSRKSSLWSWTIVWLWLHSLEM
jgi:hypothetical protein